jgi:hypothetical protein
MRGLENGGHSLSKAKAGIESSAADTEDIGIDADRFRTFCFKLKQCLRSYNFVPDLSDTEAIKEWITQARTKLFGSMHEEATTRQQTDPDRYPSQLGSIKRLSSILGSGAALRKLGTEGSRQVQTGSLSP